MMRRRIRSYAALAALAAMLFAQAAFALAACDLSRAQSRAQMVMQGAQHAECHQPADNANLCFAHCQGGEQTLDKHQVKVPDAPLHGIQVVHPWSVAPQSACPIARAPLPAAGPPPRILFRTLLI
jgi:hypothetical protein